MPGGVVRPNQTGGGREQRTTRTFFLEFYSGPSGALPAGAIWGRLGPSGAVCWGGLGRSGAVWDHLEPSGAVWGRLEPSGAAGRLVGPTGAQLPAGAIWSRLGPSGEISGCRGRQTRKITFSI